MSTAITDSHLSNKDLAPTGPERRTWGTYNLAALWIGLSIVITTYTLAAGLIELAAAAIEEVAGTSERLPSGPLHDAAEMARVMPTVMVFVKSLGGVSHTKEEDTPDADLELSVRALYDLTRRTVAWAGENTA